LTTVFQSTRRSLSSRAPQRRMCRAGRGLKQSWANRAPGKGVDLAQPGSRRGRRGEGSCPVKRVAAHEYCLRNWICQDICHGPCPADQDLAGHMMRTLPSWGEHAKQQLRGSGAHALLLVARCRVSCAAHFSPCPRLPPCAHACHMHHWQRTLIPPLGFNIRARAARRPPPAACGGAPATGPAAAAAAAAAGEGAEGGGAGDLDAACPSCGCRGQRGVAAAARAAGLGWIAERKGAGAVQSRKGLLPCKCPAGSLRSGSWHGIAMAHHSLV